VEKGSIKVVLPSNKLTEPNDVFIDINPSTGFIKTYTVDQIIRCEIKIDRIFPLISGNTDGIKEVVNNGKRIY
jgi:hypothetical protein